MADFDPRKHLMKIKGKDYLETKYRVEWFRSEHPRGCISTDVLNVDPVLVKATIYDGDGAILATGHGTGNSKPNDVWQGREIEKAETAAIGRALASAGYGTQFTDDFDDADHLADSPVERGANGKAKEHLGNGGDRRASRDMDAIYEATHHHWQHRRHFDNTVKKLVADGVLNSAMTDAQAIAAINANRAVEGKAGAAWWQDAATMKQVNETLERRHGMNASGAVSVLKVSLDQYTDAATFLAAVNDVVANMEPAAE